MTEAKSKPKQGITRPSWDEYFMDIVSLVSRRSTCLRRGVGAVLVKEKRLLTTGYNGAPSGLRHCLEVGCLREKCEADHDLGFEIMRRYAHSLAVRFRVISLQLTDMFQA